MNAIALKGLVAKEIRLTRNIFLSGLLLIILINGLVLLKAPTLEMKLALNCFLTLLHVFYMPIFVFYSLGREARQIQQWLYNPQSMNVLLSMKLLNACFSFFISLLVNCLYSVYIWFYLTPNTSTLIKDINKYTLLSLNGHQITELTQFNLIIFYIFLSSVSLSIFILLLWTIFRWLKPYFKRWSVFMAVVIFVMLIGLLNTTTIMPDNFGSFFIQYLVVDIICFFLASFILSTRVEG